MRVHRSGVLAGFAALTALYAVGANAAEPGFYVGFLYGEASKEYNVDAFDAQIGYYYDLLDYFPAQRSYTTEEDGEAYGFLAGYRLSQHIAFEGGYSYLGKQSYREVSSGQYLTGNPNNPLADESWNVSLTTETSGFTLSALGILPISYSWEVYARAGILIGSNTLDLWLSNGAQTGRDTLTESSTDWLAGAGISLSLAEVYSIRAEFQRIFDAGADEYGEADLDLISIGLTVAF